MKLPLRSKSPVTIGQVIPVAPLGFLEAHLGEVHVDQYREFRVHLIHFVVLQMQLDRHSLLLFLRKQRVFNVLLGQLFGSFSALGREKSAACLHRIFFLG